MRAFGRGIVSEQSQIYLYESSARARKLFLYALCAGHYICSDHYEVDRQSYDSYLLLYVHAGSLYVRQGGQAAEIRAPRFILVDCYHPHVYGSGDGCELYWVHFDGNSAREICGDIGLCRPLLPRNTDRARRTLMRLCEQSETGGAPDGAQMHRYLTDLLMEFLTEGKDAQHPDVIEEVRSYILDNPEKNLTVSMLAERAHLSPYHFLRRFRAQVGMTPHEYLLSVRLNVARFYLISSDQSIKEIALSCGFTSDSIFCTCFKKHTGISPGDFRAQHLH